MFAIAILILLLALAEFPAFVWVCKKKGISGLWPVALWALAVYLIHAFVLAVGFRLWIKLSNAGAVSVASWPDFFGQSGLFALYGSILFSPIYLLFAGLAYWYLKRN